MKEFPFKRDSLQLKRGIGYDLKEPHLLFKRLKGYHLREATLPLREGIGYQLRTIGARSQFKSGNKLIFTLFRH